MVSCSLRSNEDKVKVGKSIDALHESCSDYLINEFGWSKTNFNDQNNLSMLLGLRGSLNQINYDKTKILDDTIMKKNQAFTSMELALMIKKGLCLQPDDQVDPVKAYTQNGNILNVIIYMNNKEKVLAQANTLIAMFC